jgi:(S)-sulfolactate dehydrogenase
MQTNQKQVVISEFMDERAVDQLRLRYNVLYHPNLVDDPVKMALAASTADAFIVRNRTQVRGDLLDALTHCKVVGRLGVGLDNIDVASCQARGLAVIPASGANALGVAEYVIGTAMSLLRGAYSASSAVAQGQWPRNALSNGREIGGKTLGLVGFGSIGQLTAQLANGLGMNVIAYDPALAPDHEAFSQFKAQAVNLDALLSTSDVVSLHVPLVAQTRNLLSAERIAQMKAGALLINTARGGIVDEIALAAALRAGTLGGAAIDVFEQEPLPAADHFKDCPNLILTPHIAGVSLESNERVSFMIAQKVIEVLA